MSTVPPSPAWASTRTSSRPVARIAAATPEATAAALPNNECSHGTCQADSGNGVEKTSRHPVALTVTRRPSVARIAASITTRAAERLAAAAACAMARGDRARPLGGRLHGPLAGIQQPVAGREGADLVELERSRGHRPSPFGWEASASSRASSVAARSWSRS